MARERWLWAMAIVAAACGPSAPLPEGHVLVELDTDAPLPSADPLAPGAVFDAVRIAIVDAAGRPACARCEREIAWSREEASRGSTFVVQSGSGVAALVHATLFSSRLGGSSYAAGTTVEAWVRLPPRPAEGARRIRVSLPLARVGAPLGTLEQPLDGGGELPPPLTPFAPRPAPEPGPDEVCVPEALFWMGSARLPDEGELTANMPRLTRLAPYCLASHETTVREFREGRAPTEDLRAWSGTTDPNDERSYCTFTPEPGENDDRPVTCVRWEIARAYCRRRGGDLPTEAQAEYVASARGRSTFVWGEDPPRCEDAVFGRTAGRLGGDSSCAPGETRAPRAAPVAEVAATRDVLRVFDRTVVGLASNVAEWTREAFAPFDAACGRAAAGVLVDPECPADAATSRISVRGGSFTGTPAATAAAVRSATTVTHVRADLGFRCVR